MILVDTKYEFGKDEETGKILLIDEVHTPDSSRWWLASNYQENMSAGKEPENIDKEFLRLWYRANCDPYKDAEIPLAPRDLVFCLIPALFVWMDQASQSQTKLSMYMVMANLWTRAKISTIVS